MKVIISSEEALKLFSFNDGLYQKSASPGGLLESSQPLNNQKSNRHNISRRLLAMREIRIQVLKVHHSKEKCLKFPMLNISFQNANGKEMYPKMNTTSQNANGEINVPKCLTIIMKVLKSPMVDSYFKGPMVKKNIQS
ncbi:hypothetical protein CEXT_476291 [Caerostris extrusa]|uniref:Uncharacterized protein n=1 Tax=Caerostris extrusa TaxID=172846 RepID=A0AAV4QMM0_CAEEX|nr:hypothetical protein CEXT_476291 [Caerostris extrusa]